MVGAELPAMAGFLDPVVEWAARQVGIQRVAAVTTLASGAFAAYHIRDLMKGLSRALTAMLLIFYGVAFVGLAAFGGVLLGVVDVEVAANAVDGLWRLLGGLRGLLSLFVL